MLGLLLLSSVVGMLPDGVRTTFITLHANRASLCSPARVWRHCFCTHHSSWATRLFLVCTFLNSELLKKVLCHVPWHGILLSG
jgi:hypothetical protein